MCSGIQVGPFQINAYSICALIGILTACPLSIWHYKKRTGDDISMILMYLWAGVGVFVGMHLLYGITNIQYWGELFKGKDFPDFIRRFLIIFSGSVFYGGLLGGLFAGYLAIRRMKMPLDITTDCAAPFIALLHGISRIGCFLSGCCYGIEWEHGFVYHHSVVESANGVPRFPVQLVEAGFELLLAAVLWRLLVLSAKTGKLKGRLLPLYLLTYAVGRFILEFWRGDEYRGFLWGLSTSQLISIAVFACTAGYLIYNRVKRKKPE